MTYTLKELENIATLHSGQYDDLKIETEFMRAWLSRMTMADGMPYDNQVTVERLQSGRWETVEEYEALSDNIERYQ